MRSRRQDVEAPGYDSFLDVVANLVGIFIILIMVVGVRAKDALLDAPVAEEAASAEISARDVAAARSAAEDVEASITEDLAEQLQRELFEVAFRKTERDKLQTMVTAAAYELQQQRDKLSEAERDQFDVSRQLQQAKSELHQLQAGIQAVENSPAPTAVLEHLPTPMAKTVFGSELHFRLLGGRLAYVPWDDLVEKFKQEAKQKVWRLKDAPTFSETIGPMQGFRMRYTLKRVDHTTATRLGNAVQTAVELDRFILIPIAEDLGEPLEAALREDSDFQRIIAASDPRRTTVTVWTYPDSFEQFRQLKAHLFQRGYLTAARPMPEGLPIGGSPQGSRSAAQ